MAKALKAIKNMDSVVWSELKAEAARHEMPMADFLKLLIESHNERERKKAELERLADFIKKHAPYFTAEAEKLKEEVQKFRDKGFG